MSDEKDPLSRTLEEVRKSSRPEMAAVKTGDDERIRRIEQRQAKVVDLLIASIETNRDMIGKVEESLAEDERVRNELAQARAGYRRMRIAVYTLAIVFIVGVIVDVVQSERARVDALKANRATAERMEIVESNTDRALRVLLKQASAQAAIAEAEITFTPRSDEKALKQAVELQEEAAQAQIDAAHARKEEPPAEAKEALKRAIEKKESIRRPPVRVETE